MATWNRLAVVAKWQVVDGVNQPIGVNALDAGESWQDVTGQQADENGNVITTPNMYIIEVFCWETTRLQIEASNNHFVLARQSGETTELTVFAGWQNTAPEDYVINNFDNQVTLAQASTFKATILNRFPDADLTDLQENLVDLIEAGITRQAVIVKLIKKWQKFLKALN